MTKPSDIPKGVGIILCPANHSGIYMSTRIEEGKEFFGYDQTPGGAVEPGEDPKAAIIRELEEECGILLHPSAITPLVDGVWEKPSGQLYHSYQFLAVTSLVPENKEPQKHTEWKVVPWSRILSKTIIGPIRMAVEDLLRKNPGLLA